MAAVDTLYHLEARVHAAQSGHTLGNGRGIEPEGQGQSQTVHGVLYVVV